MNLTPMSPGDLQAFREAIKNDTALSLQLQGLSSRSDIVTLAAGLGFVLSTEDVQALSEELAPQELEGIRGGILAMPPDD